MECTKRVGMYGHKMEPCGTKWDILEPFGNPRQAPFSLHGL